VKQIFILTIAVMMSGLFGCASLESETATAQTQQSNPNQSNKSIETRAKTPVLVELFTSEGCSSCPPADRLLSQLEKGQASSEAEIITLALHVDYWNYLGWKDEFSQKQFSERQNGYAQHFKLDSSYTPQMVVDGQTQLVGSNSDAAQKAISELMKNQKAAIEISNSNDKLKVKITDAPAHDDSYVWLAIAEDDLKTNVRRGENVGKTLDHVSVVREMKLLGSIAAADKSFESETALQFNPVWKKENLKFVVFLQGKDSKKVFGVKKLDN
jgi:hypothetical protein